MAKINERQGKYVAHGAGTGLEYQRPSLAVLQDLEQAESAPESVSTSDSQGRYREIQRAVGPPEGEVRMRSSRLLFMPSHRQTEGQRKTEKEMQTYKQRQTV